MEDAKHDEDTADLTNDANNLVDMSVQVGDTRRQLFSAAGVCGKAYCLILQLKEKTEKLSSFHSFFFSFMMMVFQVPRRCVLVYRVNRKIVYRIDQDVGRRSEVRGRSALALPCVLVCLIITLNCSVACACAFVLALSDQVK